MYMYVQGALSGHVFLDPSGRAAYLADCRGGGRAGLAIEMVLLPVEVRCYMFV